jgi:hypothetical protein
MCWKHSVNSIIQFSPYTSLLSPLLSFASPLKPKEGPTNALTQHNQHASLLNLGGACGCRSSYSSVTSIRLGASRLCTHRGRPRAPRAAPGATNRLGSVVIEALVGGRERWVTGWTARARCWQTARSVSRGVWTLQVVRMEEGGIVARGKFRPWWKVSPVSDQRH